MYERILVPLDGSTLAECALPHVKNLFKRGVVKEITLINIFTLYLPGRGVIPGSLDIRSMRKNLLNDSRKYLADVSSRLASEGMPVKTESLEGNRPADAIADYAQNHGIDLIVIATHGYTGLKKLMLGSVAMSILHDSRVPVLLIRPESCQI